MPDGKARKASKAKLARVTGYSLGVLRNAGVNYRTSSRGGVTITGRGRKPRSLFPRSPFRIIRNITY